MTVFLKNKNNNNKNMVMKHIEEEYQVMMNLVNSKVQIKEVKNF